MKRKLAAKLIPFFAAGAVLTAGPSAFAKTCQATVDYVQVLNDGSVVVRVTGGGFQYEMSVCGLTSTRVGGNTTQNGTQNITPDLCRGWFTVLNAAVLSGRQTTFYIHDSASCTTNIYGAWAQYPTGKGLFGFQM